MKFACVILICAATPALAGDLDMMGVTLLRQVDPGLAGGGVSVAQVEAPLNTNQPPPFEVNPSSIGVSAGLFDWISSLGTAATYPNSVGAESSHADGVGGNFYGPGAGVATNLAHIDNYEADYFYNSVISAVLPPSINAAIANQSFIFTQSQQQTIDSQYDNYAARQNVLFVSGAGNGGSVYPAATCYNGIGVGAYGGSSSVGPTLDNGRCKPDITAPAGATSFSTAYVSGGAAVVLQACRRGDGGPDTNAALDIRTLKALLLNGAVKPAGWTNGPATPLDARYGAGVMNVFNSWRQLAGREHSFIESTANPAGGAHPPGASAGNEPALSGWDFNSITNARSGPGYNDEVNHYYFNLAGTNRFTLTASLVWNRQAGQSGINDLNLFLFNAANSNLVACSTSLVDNVEQLFLPEKLPPGRYDLQVEKNPLSQVSAAETYALAFEFFNIELRMARTSGVTQVSWPIYPAGFRLVSAPALAPPVTWSTIGVGAIVVDTNAGLNRVSVPITNAAEFFRLQRP